jgi:PRTRC genetic system ThiF family protein
MQTLTIDPAVPYLLPSDRPIVIALVGCGGTGSHIAQSLARLAAHCHALGGPSVELGFIDGDRVEHCNVGRQLFSASEVGRNKAQTLAARFSAALGLSIMAIPEMATALLLCERVIAPPRDALGILVGAVDGAAGRKALHDALKSESWHVWLDCGNHESSGQVVVGTTTDLKRLGRAFGLPGVCAALPAPSMVYPDLLVAPPPRPRADCAAAMEDNAQSLMVNQAMAAVAAEYLYNLVVRRRLTTFETVVDLAGLAMRSTPITAANLARVTGLAEAAPQQPKRKKRAA